MMLFPDDSQRGRYVDHGGRKVSGLGLCPGLFQKRQERLRTKSTADDKKNQRTVNEKANVIVAYMITD